MLPRNTVVSPSGRSLAPLLAHLVAICMSCSIEKPNLCDTSTSSLHGCHNRSKVRQVVMHRTIESGSHGVQTDESTRKNCCPQSQQGAKPLLQNSEKLLEHREQINAIMISMKPQLCHIITKRYTKEMLKSYFHEVRTTMALEEAKSKVDEERRKKREEKQK